MKTRAGTIPRPFHGCPAGVLVRSSEMGKPAASDGNVHNGIRPDGGKLRPGVFVPVVVFHRGSW